MVFLTCKFNEMKERDKGEADLLHVQLKRGAVKKNHEHDIVVRDGILICWMKM